MADGDIYGRAEYSQRNSEGNPDGRITPDATKEVPRKPVSKSPFRSIAIHRRNRKIVFRVFISLVVVYAAGALYVLSTGIIRAHRESGGRRFRFLSVATGVRPEQRVDDQRMSSPDEGIPFADTLERLAATSRAVTAASLLLDKGLHQQAIRRIRETDEIIIENAQVQFTLARAYRAARNYEQALEYLLLAVANDPGNLEIRIALAGTLGEMGRHTDMVRAAEWALERAPLSLEALGHAGRGNLNLGKFENAASFFREMLRLDPDNQDAHSGLALSYYRAGEHGRAIRHLTALLDKPLEQPQVFLTLALFYAEQEMVADTADVINRAVQRFGEDTVHDWILNPQFTPLLELPELKTLLRLEAGRLQDQSLIMGRRPPRPGTVTLPAVEPDQDRLNLPPRR